MKGFKIVRKLKCFIHTLFSIGVALLTSSFAEKPQSNEILNQDDIAEVMQTTRPTITSDDGMESYWKWQCFPSANIRVSCSCESDLTKNANSRTERDQTENSEDNGDLIVSVDSNGRRFDFDYEFDAENCSEKLTQVQQLLKNQGDACFLASYLQQTFENEDSQLWIMYKIKNASGYWPENIVEAT